jgi:hypothetical protein
MLLLELLSAAELLLLLLGEDDIVVGVLFCRNGEDWLSSYNKYLLVSHWTLSQSSLLDYGRDLMDHRLLGRSAWDCQCGCVVSFFVS